MSSEEAENGRENMEIDRCEPQSPRGDAALDANFLKVYYGKLFPHEDIFKCMSYGNDGKHPGCDQSYFVRREFSFTLENDIYLRYQSFNSLSVLEKSLNEKCPVKIDIGHIYNVDPAKRRAYVQAGDYGFIPVERELIFDLDVTDYDDVRYCCSDADVCLDYWPLMTVAIKVIDTVLRGFCTSILISSYKGLAGCISCRIIIPLQKNCNEMTLDSITFCGCTVADVVSIVGFVIGKQEG